MAIALVLHVCATLIWVGGMFFAYVCLRPSVGGIEPPVERLRLWKRVFARFFPWVWLAVLTLLATGFWMLFGLLGGFANAGVHVHIMLTVGVVMMLLFAHLFFVDWRRFRAAVDQDLNESAILHLGKIRRVVAINLMLGLATVVIAVSGPYWR